MSESIDVSIVIPSRNNRDRLRATLESATRLDYDTHRFEVIVEDDGSTDGTFETFRDRRFPFGFAIGRGEHGNQSAATNAAADRARGRILICAASDLIFDPRFVRRHVEMHRRHGTRDVAVLGFLPYLPELNERPFIYYLMNGGPQFGYTAIRDTRRLGPNFCYAPNLSLSREVYRRVGGFDPFFRYGGQDTDLGYRLAAAGVRLVYEPEAVAWHDHPVTPESYAHRQQAAGVSTALLAERYPSLEGGAPLWDGAIAGYLCYGQPLLDRDRRVIATLEPEVARSYPEYQRVWSSVAVKRGDPPTDLTLDDATALFDRTKTLFTAYDRLNRFWWGKAFVEESIRRLGPETVRRTVEERLLKLQATLQGRRTLERRMASHGIEIRTSDPDDVFDSLIIHGLDGYQDALSALVAYSPPQEGCYNRQIILVIDGGGLSGDERVALEQLADVVTAECDGRGLIDALRLTRGTVVTVHRGPLLDESPDARWVVDRLLARIESVRIISAGSGDRGGRICIGLRSDGTPIVIDDDEKGAGSPIPVAIPSPDHWSMRGDDARSIDSRADALPDEYDLRWLAALGAMVGGRCCWVPRLRRPAPRADGTTTHEPRLERSVAGPVAG